MVKGDELGVSRETFGKTQEGLGMEGDQYPKVPLPVRLLRAGERLRALLRVCSKLSWHICMEEVGTWEEDSLSGRVIDPCAHGDYNSSQRMCKVRQGGK